MDPVQEPLVLLVDWRQGIEKQGLYSTWFGDLERARCEALQSSSLRLKYICSHGLLRESLAAVLNKSPDSFSFIQNPYGKLALNCGLIQFSLSHSENMLAIAFSRCSDIGVDIEGVKEVSGLKDIAKNFFSPRELLILEKYAGRSFLKTFYKIWTSKEAIVKCMGTGFDCEVNEICTFDPVSLSEDGPDLFFQTVFRDHVFDVCVNEHSAHDCILAVAVRDRLRNRGLQIEPKR